MTHHQPGRSHPRTTSAVSPPPAIFWCIENPTHPEDFFESYVSHIQTVKRFFNVTTATKAKTHLSNSDSLMLTVDILLSFSICASWAVRLDLFLSILSPIT